MYGSLEETDVSSLLNFFSEQQRSGIFFIENELSAKYQKNIYFIFFSKGNILFAGDTDSFTFQRIRDYLRYYNLTDNFNGFQKKLNELGSIAEYEAILLLESKSLMSTEDLKSLYRGIIEEILFKMITLNKGNFIWQNSFDLQPLIMTIKIEAILPSVMKKQVAWQKLFPYIKDIEQCPILIKEEDYFDTENINKKLLDNINGKTSLIQLSRILNYSVVEVAQMLYPYIQKGFIKLINQPQIEVHSNLFDPINGQIIGFSTSNQWTLNINKISAFHNYNVVIPDDINKFFTYIFNLPIKLIILQSQINNNYNTYNLCKIVRNNSRTSNLPIIMVVNEYLFKDNLISKMYGVTEYISQNFFQKRMLKIIDKYL